MPPGTFLLFEPDRLVWLDGVPADCGRTPAELCERAVRSRAVPYDDLADCIVPSDGRAVPQPSNWTSPSVSALRKVVHARTTSPTSVRRVPVPHGAPGGHVLAMRHPMGVRGPAAYEADGRPRRRERRAP